MKQELDSLIEDAMIAADGQAILPLHTAYELVTKAYKSGTNARVQLLAKALQGMLDYSERVREVWNKHQGFGTPLSVDGVPEVNEARAALTEAGIKT